MSAPLRFTVAPDEAGRADRILAGRFPDASRRSIAALFRDRAVRVNGRLARKGTMCAAGAEIALASPPPGREEMRPVAEDVAGVDVLYADAALVVVNKPPGIASQPLRAGERGTVANALCARFPDCRPVGRDPREAGLLHRLDIGTSGALAAARDQASWKAARAAFAHGRVRKRYLALASASLADTGAVTAPLAQRGRRAVVDRASGLPAETRWRVVERLGQFALVECDARTGRMHQIRAHLAEAGAPIAGDALYGGTPLADRGLVGHFLHAARLELPHPRTGEAIAVVAPLAPDRARVLAALRGGRAERDRGAPSTPSREGSPEGGDRRGE